MIPVVDRSSGPDDRNSADRDRPGAHRRVYLVVAAFPKDSSGPSKIILSETYLAEGET